MALASKPSISATLAVNPYFSANFPVFSASPAAFPVWDPNNIVSERSWVSRDAIASETPALTSTAAGATSAATSATTSASTATGSAPPASSNLITSTGQASAASIIKSPNSVPIATISGFFPSFMSRVPSCLASAIIIDVSSPTTNTSGQISSHALQVIQSGSIQTFAITVMMTPR